MTTGNIDSDVAPTAPRSDDPTPRERRRFDAERLREQMRGLMYPELGWAHQLRVLRRRMRWIVAIGIIVGTPMLLFALVGMPHVLRTPAVRVVVSELGRGHAPAARAPEFRSTFALLTESELLPGNRAELLANGAVFPRLWDDLRAARRSITMQMYYAGTGQVADSCVRILSERARAGVQVYFLIDAFGGGEFADHHVDSLRAAGVRTSEFHPLEWYSLDRASHRLHVRGIVVDGAIGYTGGFGLDDKWLGNGLVPEEWRETNTRFTGPVVLRLQSVFVAKWAESTGEALASEHLFPSALPGPVANDPLMEAALVFSPPGVGSSTGARLVALAIVASRQRLWITSAYFVPDLDFVGLLGDAARRGVDVRILTNGDKTDVRTTQIAGRSRYDSLLASGVRIWEYQPTTLHSKTLVVDGLLAIVATMNFDNRSLAYNDEVALVMRDESFAEQLEMMFEADLRHAAEFRLETFRERPWHERLLEWGASKIADVL
jgi:cardiolipin synthase A/B